MIKLVLMEDKKYRDFSKYDYIIFKDERDYHSSARQSFPKIYKFTKSGMSVNTIVTPVFINGNGYDPSEISDLINKGKAFVFQGKRNHKSYLEMAKTFCKLIKSSGLDSEEGFEYFYSESGNIFKDDNVIYKLVLNYFNINDDDKNSQWWKSKTKIKREGFTIVMDYWKSLQDTQEYKNWISNNWQIKSIPDRNSGYITVEFRDDNNDVKLQFKLSISVRSHKILLDIDDEWTLVSNVNQLAEEIDKALNTICK